MVRELEQPLNVLRVVVDGGLDHRRRVCQPLDEVIRVRGRELLRVLLLGHPQPAEGSFELVVGGFERCHRQPVAFLGVFPVGVKPREELELEVSVVLDDVLPVLPEIFFGALTHEGMRELDGVGSGPNLGSVSTEAPHVVEGVVGVHRPTVGWSSLLVS